MFTGNVAPTASEFSNSDIPKMENQIQGKEQNMTIASTNPFPINPVEKRAIGAVGFLDRSDG